MPDNAVHGEVKSPKNYMSGNATYHALQTGISAKHLLYDLDC